MSKPVYTTDKEYEFLYSGLTVRLVSALTSGDYIFTDDKQAYLINSDGYVKSTINDLQQEKIIPRNVVYINIYETKAYTCGYVTKVFSLKHLAEQHKEYSVHDQYSNSYPSAKKIKTLEVKL